MKKADTINAWASLPENIRTALVNNNLISLKPEERITLYTEICGAKGLDPATRPFEFISLNGKLTMYARKECADQLRERNGVSAEIVSATVQGDAYVVHIRAKNAEGRVEDDIGATGIAEPEFLSKQVAGKTEKYPNPRYGKKMEGVDVANAMMKAVTKGKRRVTLAICGLGMYDESEIEGIAESEKGKAPSLEEVQRIAGEVRALRERAAKGPKNEAQDLIRQACALEETILGLPGSGHEASTEQPKPAPTPEPATAPQPSAPVNTPPVVQKPVVEAPAASAEAPKESAQGTTVITGQTNVTAHELPLAKPEPAPVAETAPVQAAASVPAGDSAPPSDWRNYTIRVVPHKAFKGKKLGEVAKENIKIIHDNWALKFADEISKNPDKTADAQAIAAAVKELGL